MCFDLWVDTHICSIDVFCVFLRLARHRQIAEPELVAESSEDSDEGTWHPEREESSEEEEEEEEVDDEVSVESRGGAILKWRSVAGNVA